MFFATSRTIFKGSYDKHFAAVSHHLKTTISSSRYHSKQWLQYWHRFSQSASCTNVIHSRTIIIPKVPSLLSLQSKGGRHIYGATWNNFVAFGGRMRSCHSSPKVLPELEALYDGNRLFRKSIASSHPGLLKTLAEQGQYPPFMFLNCSDSRVCAKTIFSTKPGTIFTIANIANQYNEHDLSANSGLSFAINVLGVQHVVVMGHYGCGGVEAAFSPRVDVSIDGTTSSADPAVNPVHQWITPIRRIYQNSTRKEIIEHRERKYIDENVGPLHIRDPAFRALVEENVKANVQRIARSNLISIRNQTLSSAINQKNQKMADSLIHGWVYDIETGEVMDLGVSVGPLGREVPRTPFRLTR